MGQPEGKFLGSNSFVIWEFIFFMIQDMSGGHTHTHTQQQQ